MKSKLCKYNITCETYAHEIYIIMVLLCILVYLPLSLLISLTQGDILTLLRQIDDNWYEGTVGEDKGIIPANYIQVFEAATEEQ